MALAKKNVKYQRFQRYWNSILMLCIILTVISGATHGIEVSAILWRSFVVFFGFALGEVFLIRCWSTWEIIQYANIRKRPKN